MWGQFICQIDLQLEQYGTVLPEKLGVKFTSNLLQLHQSQWKESYWLGSGTL